MNTSKFALKSIVSAVILSLMVVAAGCGGGGSSAGSSGGGTPSLASLGYTLTGKVVLPDGSSGPGILVMASQVNEGGVTSQQARVLAARPTGPNEFKKAVQTASDSVGTYLTMTDAEGVYVLSGLDQGTYFIEASRDGMKATSRAVVSPNEASVVDLELTPTGSLSGTGELEGAEPGEHAGTFVVIKGTDYIGYTGSDGSFVIHQIPVGSYQVTFVHPGYESYDYPDSITIPTADTENLSTVTLASLKGGAIEGVVTAQDQEPVEGVMVKVEGLDRYGMTDADGAYRLDDVPAGTHTMQFHHDLVEVGVEETGVVVTKMATATLNAEFLDDKPPVWEGSSGVVYVTEITPTEGGYSKPAAEEISVAVEFGRAFDASPPLTVMVYFNHVEDWDAEMWENNNPGEYGESEIYEGIRGEYGVIVTGLIPGARYLFGVRAKDRHGNLEFNRSEYLHVPGEGVISPEERENLLTAVGNIGIGTKDPQGLFHVEASDGSAFVVAAETGNVGIGTTAPDAALTVGSDEQLPINAASGVFKVQSDGTVTAGTWQGDPIADGYIGSVSGSKVTGDIDASQISGSIPASQIAGDIPTSQLSGSIPGAQIAGDIPGKAAGVTGVVPLESGGTGAATAEQARINLGISTTGGLVAWGELTGTLSDQADLQGELEALQGNITTNQDDITSLATAVDSKESSVTAGTAAQYYRGDKSWQTLTTTTVPEGDNVYWTQDRFDAALAGKSTDDLLQGSVNHYSPWTLNGSELVYTVGNVGISTTSPGEKLHVNGKVRIGDYTLPSTDGTGGQVLATNGSGILSWNDLPEDTDTHLTDSEIGTMGYIKTYSETDPTVTLVKLQSLVNDDFHALGGVDVTLTDSQIAAMGYIKTDTNTTYSAGDGLALDGTSFSLSQQEAVSGQVLKWSGSAWAPGDDINEGDVTGPASVADHAVARFDGITGKVIQAAGVVIDDSGNVGIGTTSPTEFLHIKGSGYPWMIIESTDEEGGGLSLQSSGEEWQIYLEDTDLSFFQGDDETGSNRVVFKAGGNVGIGTTDPSVKLEVLSTTNNDGLSLKTVDGYNSYIRFHEGSAVKAAISHGGYDDNFNLSYPSSGFLSIREDYDEVLRVMGGMVGIGVTSPDEVLHLKDGALRIGDDTDAYTIFSADPGDDVVYLTSHNAILELNSVSDEDVSLAGGGGRVGIGNTEPESRLHITGDTGAGGRRVTVGDSFTPLAPPIDQHGDPYLHNLGVLTDYGGQDNEVQGAFRATDGDDIIEVLINHKYIGSAPWRALSVWGLYSQGATTEYFYVGAEGEGYFSGNVGIGTSAPGYPLDVDGSIHLISGAIVFPDGSQMNSAGTGSANSLSNTADLLITADSDSAAGGEIQFNISGSEKMVILNDGKVGIGTESPAGGLDISHGSLSLVLGANNGASTRTDATEKVSRIVASHYTKAEEPFAMMVGSALETDNMLQIGGGTTMANAATSVSFYTAANTTSTLGTERMTITSDGTVGIGTTSPSGRLEVQGGKTRIVSDDSFAGQLQVVNSSDNAESAIGFMDNGQHGTGTEWWVMGRGVWDIGAANFGICRQDVGSGGVALTILGANGNVGIGTTTPSQKLEVSGNVLATVLIGQTIESTAVGFKFPDGTTQSTSAGDSHSLDAADGSPADAVFVDNDGNVGVGTSSPSRHLHSVSSGIPLLAERSTTQTGITYTAASFQHTTSGDMADGFGPIIDFQIADGGAAAGQIAAVGAVRSGADNSGSLFLRTKNAGADVEVMRLTPAGNVGLGTTAPSQKLHVIGNGIFGLDSGASGVRGLTLRGDTGASDADLFTIGFERSFYNPGENAAEIAFGRANGGAEADIRFKTQSSASSLVERMRIDNSGNVGIGTASPGTSLHIFENSGDPTLRLEATGTDSPVIEFKNTDVTANFNGMGIAGASGDILDDAAAADFALTLRTGGAIRLSADTNHLASKGVNILANGKVGIGTTAPSYLLEVAGTARAEFMQVEGTDTVGVSIPLYVQGDTTDMTYGTNTFGRLIRFFDAGQTDAYYDIGIDSSASLFISKKASTTAAMTITGTGNVGIGTTAPGAKLHMADTGSVVLKLEADTDDTTETDHPYMFFVQDGGTVSASVGYT